ncbi:hypothetical protein TNCV_21771 [Trichonephila clavipes]|nr:hypothetical protein TNCV_21771 [Trichonephila clavipes]
MVALLSDSVRTYDVFFHPDGLCFLTRGIRLIASRQEILCFVLLEATDGDIPLPPLALLVEVTAGVGMSHAPFVNATAVSLLKTSETENAYLLDYWIACGF